MNKYFLLIATVFAFSTQVLAKTIRYVKEGATGNGSSWSAASGDVQAMIQASKEGDEVWVAKGMYKPNRRGDKPNDVNNGNDRFNAFVLKKNVSVFGGFEGTETTIAERILTNQLSASILSGNIGDADSQLDNTYHVVIAAGDLGSGMLLDGFTIEDGYTEAIEGTANFITVNGENLPSTRAAGAIVYNVKGLEFKNVYFKNNINVSSNQHAGAIYALNSRINISDSKFTGNITTAPGWAGGAVKMHGNAANPTIINFTRVLFQNNEAGNGAAIAATNFSTVIVNECTFLNNIANHRSATGGGAIALVGSDDVLIVNNSAFKGNSSATHGGAIASRYLNTPITVTNSIFEDNFTYGTGNGGAIGFNADGGNLKVVGSTFKRNYTNAAETHRYGGAIYMNSASGSIEIATSTFLENYTTSNNSYGGAVYLNGIKARLVITKSSFTANSTKGVTGNGGAVYLNGDNSTSDISEVNFSENKSLSDYGEGGVLFLNGAGLTANLEKSFFKNNSTNGFRSYGGAVNFKGANAALAVNDCDFEDNTTGDYFSDGAGIRVLGDNISVKIARSRFLRNITVVPATSTFPTRASNGAGLFVDGANSSTTVINSTFDGNKVLGTNSTGGAIHVAKGKELHLDNVRFSGNEAEYQGGAVWVQDLTGNSTIFKSIVMNNKASRNGGGGTFLQRSAFVIENTRYTGNTALNGAAVNVVGAPSLEESLRPKVVFINVGFYNNTAVGGTVGGSGVLVYNFGRLQFYNSTFYNNKYDRDGKTGANNNLKGASVTLQTSCEATLTNCISWHDDATKSDDEFYMTSTAVPSKYTFTNTLSRFYGSNGIWGNVVGTNPQILDVDPFSDNFLGLSATSIAIDKGDFSQLPNGIYFDLNGKGRLAGGKVDLGAVEFGGALAVAPSNFQVDENTASGVVIGKPQFSLAGTLSNWRFLSGNVLGAFKIDAATGVISVEGASHLDYEVNKSFLLDVLVDNENGDVQLLNVKVVINNLMENPETPVTHNATAPGNVIANYRPTIGGKAEPFTEVTIYIDGVAYKNKPVVDASGTWKYVFTENLPAGAHTVNIITHLDGLGTSERSGDLKFILALFEGMDSIKANNILTPNGDGKNDVWEIQNLAYMYPKNEVVVFDKAGKIVFIKQNYTGDWDGTSNGVVLPAGTYYYLITTVKDLAPIKGSLTILR